MTAQSGTPVRTMLSRPPVPPDLVPRDRLLDMLQTNPSRRFTLVSAPAGCGKSTLVSRWVEAGDLPAAWLSLDEEDIGLRGFLEYFIAAVRTHSPSACRRSHGLLGAAALPPPTVLGNYLADDLQAIRRPFMLVLDDYHRIVEPAIHDLLDQVLRRPIRSFHLVLVTRHDPPLSLPALLAQSWALDVRERDLRFTREETREVVHKLAGISIGDDTLAHLHAALEGWIVGLRLVCLSLRNQPDPEAFLTRLEAGTPNVLEYLAAEVLSRLPRDLRARMLRASILSRFCAPLCEAVCAGVGEDSAIGTFSGEAFLKDLQRENLFTIRLDSPWFRFHHVFQDLLRRQLGLWATAEEIRALHRRASDWFSSRNLIDEAIEHALAAGDPEAAADIVEANRLAILNADRWPILAGWLSQLPEAIVWRRPELLLGEAWLAYYRFRIPALDRVIARLDGLLDSGSVRPAWDGEIALFKSFLCYWQGQAQEMLAHVERAQSTLPATHDLMRADSEIYFGLAHHLVGREDTAIDALTARIREHPEQEGLLVTRRVITLAFVHMLSGRLREAATHSRQLGELARASSPIYIRSWSTYLSGCCHFQSGDWEQAERCFRWIEENRYVSHTAAVVSSLTGLGLALHFQGRPEEAHEAGRRLLDYAVETKDPANLDLAESGRVRIELLADDARGAAPPNDSADLATAFLFLEVPTITQCRLLLARGTPDALTRAVGRIDELREEAEAIHNTFHLIDLVAMQAVACQQLGRSDEAEAALEHALALADPGGWVRPFAELGPPMARLLSDLARKGRARQVARILGALTTHPPPGQPSPDAPTTESLTHREADVLGLLAERLYDKEIAAKLFISIATVKTHLRHIYEKLAVGNRREAVRKAERLGLLPKN